jgi:hypothetical protein
VSVLPLMLKAMQPTFVSLQKPSSLAQVNSLRRTRRLVLVLWRLSYPPRTILPSVTSEFGERKETLAPWAEETLEYGKFQSSPPPLTRYEVAVAEPPIFRLLPPRDCRPSHR